jgi:hypothetical protein
VRIGIDFDNTIVNYDALFHKVALEQGVIPQTLAASKLAVRNHLRAIDKEDVWTEMQGYVYGARMDEAAMYPGVLDFFRRARVQDINLAIVSHKTRHPFIGPQYDLHRAAREWVDHHLVDGGDRLIAPEQVYFELTKDAKIKRIDTLACDCFIDDLPEIFLAEKFPAATQRFLFDPDAHHPPVPGIDTVQSWGEFQKKLCGPWQANR